MPQRKSWKLCKLILVISFGYFFSKSLRSWQKSRFENSRWATDNIGITNRRRSSSAAHLGFSNRDFFQIWNFLLKCYPKITTGSLHNCSGCLHWVISVAHRLYCTFLGQEIPACDRMSSLAKFLFMIQFKPQWVVNNPHIITFLKYILVFK